MSTVSAIFMFTSFNLHKCLSPVALKWRIIVQQRMRHMTRSVNSALECVGQSECGTNYKRQRLLCLQKSAWRNKNFCTYLFTWRLFYFNNYNFHNTFPYCSLFNSYLHNTSSDEILLIYSMLHRLQTINNRCIKLTYCHNISQTIAICSHTGTAFTCISDSINKLLSWMSIMECTAIFLQH